MKLISRYFYSIILSICFLTNLSGQSIQQKADSLFTLLENTTIDTVKAKYYIDLGKMYYYNEPNKSILFLHKALAISEKTQFEKGLSNSYSFLFNVHDALGSHSDSLLFYVELMEDLYEKTGNIKCKVEEHWNRGIYYQTIENNDKGINEYLKALQLVRQHNLSKLKEARLLGNLGNSWYIDGDYKEAVKYYKKAIPLLQDDKIGQSTSYFNLGTIYSRELNEMDSALQVFSKTFALAEETEDHSLKALILIEQGYCNDVNRNYEQANILYQSALQISKQYNLGENFILIFTAFSKHYLERKQYRRSIEYSGKGLKVSEEQKKYELLSELYEIQETAYAKLGDYKNAYEIKTKLTNHLDSINSAEIKGRIKELQTKYEVEEKEAENKFLKLNLQSRQRFSVILIIALIFAIAFGVAVFRSSQQRKKYNQLLEQKVAERTKDLEQANYELRTFNYIASHDIKEPIRNIGSYVGLIRRKLPKELKESLNDYFDIIKRSTTQLYTLIEDFAYYTTMSKSEVIKKEEVDLNVLIYNVIDNLQESIQKYNGQVFSNKLPIIKTGNSLLFTTLKNLIENGLKYNRAEKPTVNINYNQTKAHHEIIVSDNGIGIDKQYNDKIFEMFKRLHNRGEYEGSGIGLAIVKLSVDKLGGTIDVKSTVGKGSQFIIKLERTADKGQVINKELDFEQLRTV